ncbi:MAG: alkaline phosphatase family protein [Actinobacteria bacterium]|nr:alkaline phosphatase family protein [Actinomycetota bacterium]MCA1719870.1 alkaline phosphatase family protein [Actinomycetota bacterium]
MILRRTLPLVLSLGLLGLAALPAGAATPDPKKLSSLGIGHVFVVNIENKTFDEAYVSNKNPYLPKQLRAQGVLLRQYFGTAHLSLPNYIAELSGQAPTKINQSDCQIYMDVQPGAPGPMGQSIGDGCVYPANVQTLPNQLTGKGLTWRGYMEDMGNDFAREADRCGEPANPTGAGFRDGTQTATAKDQYAARHNPFVYFHSILDSPLCHQRVVPLTALQTDLAKVETTANYNVITPNLCNDGHDDPCVGKNLRGTQAGGLVSADYWLQKYVPVILSSPAFKKDGVLIVTSDESEATLTETDATACCNEQPGFNTPLPGIGGPGGGRIGTLVLGRCVKPGSTSDVPYNHYSMLRSVEDMFGISTGGADGKGHLGYAGADGLAPFGPDVFAGSCASAVRASPLRTVSKQLPRTGGLPVALAALVLTGAALTGRSLLRKAS